MRPRPRGIVFDLWNTLAAGTGPVNPVLHAGQVLERAGAADWRGAIERGMMRRRMSGIEEAIPSIEKEAGIRLDPSSRREIERVWRETADDVMVFPDVTASLERLRRSFRLALLSNTQSFDLEPLERTGLFARFDVVHLSCDTGLLKPDAATFGAVTRALGVPRPEVLMVGDNWNDDILGARGAGLEAVLMRRRGGRLSHLEPARSEEFVEDLPGLETRLGS